MKELWRGSARAEPRGEGSRPQRAGPVPGMRGEGARGSFDQVAGAGRITAHSLTGVPCAASAAPGSSIADLMALPRRVSHNVRQSVSVSSSSSATTQSFCKNGVESYG